jgi:hypothetical protein
MWPARQRFVDVFSTTLSCYAGRPTRDLIGQTAELPLVPPLRLVRHNRAVPETAAAEPPMVGIVGSAAGGVQGLRTGFVEPALARGWRVGVTLTPTAATWLRPLQEIERMADLTGLPVRSTPRLPTEPKPHPTVDCYVVAPASANTLAKLALGLADTQATTQVCEAIGNSVPVVVFPRANSGHTGHPAWRKHVDALREAGVAVIDSTDQDAPMPWPRVLDAVQNALERTGQRIEPPAVP